jgi:hypothetical protein
MARSELNGNRIINKNKSLWYYEDDLQIVDFSNPRPCPHCKKNVTSEGHDACLGTLPNVMFACCGHHSSNGHPYVMFSNGEQIDFDSTESLYKFFNINTNLKDKNEN